MKMRARTSLKCPREGLKLKDKLKIVSKDIKFITQIDTQYNKNLKKLIYHQHLTP